ncbi:Acylglycerol kinase, mitochondrial [Armadillidium nasatum]|uniref:Acylglycerol kinase, mitochondrial n=1 Tax=Armadillidium nasatum TaxID=96803 RepID=A0A5N5SX88_9CRUS|nr:Acylglycerol kinase, mitochondrial [Armadillidium nasatum]
MVLKVFRIIKNHPKKIIFFSSVIGFAGRYGKQKYDEQCLMRAYCEEASKFGDELYHLGDEERHITVILNPAANNGKCSSKYEKYCAPLFHLAGMKVAVMKTEYENQAKEIMNVMDNTHGVVVAGGDGTLSEVLTGLLRREDSSTACRKFPLGILPLGVSNSAASSIWGFNKTPEVEHLAEATMSIIKNFRRGMDVIEVTPFEEGENKKPVYAASQIEWGAFRDAEVRKSVYWYWSFLKTYMVYVFSSYKDLSWNCSADIKYCHPCSGCCKCKEKEQREYLEALKKKPRRWWEAFIPRSKNNSEEEHIDYSTIINEKCGEIQDLSLSNVCDVRIVSSNSTKAQNINGYSLSLQIGKEDLSSFDFIKEGWRRERGYKPTIDNEFIVGEIFLNPSDNVLKDKAGEDRKLSIDNENFEVKPMKIRPKENAVTIFAPPKLKPALNQEIA